MFFDNASTTKIDDSIMADLQKLNSDYFYNPGALYKNGRSVRKEIDVCRESILTNIGGLGSGNLIFTGSASEANNLALFGSVRKNFKKILVSMGEHPSVYNCALELQNRGYNVEYVNLQPDGKVDFEDFKSKMTPDVSLVSIMYVSNETGAINNIAELCQYAKDIIPKVIFHCDAVQCAGKLRLDVDDLGVDLCTISAHKFHGMKGVGALYVKKGVMLKPIIYGGGQEVGLRSGTENYLGIYTMSRALEIAVNDLQNNWNYVSNLKKCFLDELARSNLNYSIHSFDDNSPYIVSLSFVGCRAETILNMLSDKDICIGNGSACSSKKSDNRILDNMGVSKAEIESNLRISFSKNNSEDEVLELVKQLKECVIEYLKKV